MFLGLRLIQLRFLFFKTRSKKSRRRYFVGRLEQEINKTFFFLIWNEFSLHGFGLFFLFNDGHLLIFDWNWTFIFKQPEQTILINYFFLFLELRTEASLHDQMFNQLLKIKILFTITLELALLVHVFFCLVIHTKIRAFTTNNLGVFRFAQLAD
jgi:hypothetical protein